MPESRPFSVTARARSFVFAFRGIGTILRSQHNAWIHAAATVAVCALGLALGLESLEWCAVVLALVAVWVAEGFNTAIELVSDAALPEFHPLIEKAKDVAAGAVLIAALGATAIAVFVFLPKLKVLFAG